MVTASPVRATLWIVESVWAQQKPWVKVVQAGCSSLWRSCLLWCVWLLDAVFFGWGDDVFKQKGNWRMKGSVVVLRILMETAVKQVKLIQSWEQDIWIAKMWEVSDPELWQRINHGNGSEESDSDVLMTTSQPHDPFAAAVIEAIDRGDGTIRNLTFCNWLLERCTRRHRDAHDRASRLFYTDAVHALRGQFCEDVYWWNAGPWWPSSWNAPRVC